MSKLCGTSFRRVASFLRDETLHLDVRVVGPVVAADPAELRHVEPVDVPRLRELLRCGRVGDLCGPAVVVVGRQLAQRGRLPVAEVLPAELGNSAGVIGAADLARRI